MKVYILFSVVCLHLGCPFGEAAGVGVYSYQDSSGNRYGGSFDLNDAQFYNKRNKQGASEVPPGQVGHGDWGNFVPFVPNFQPFDDFFPEYFSNLENLLQEAFNKNFENQKLAFDAAKKAYDLTSNQAGYIPHSPGRFGNFADFPFMSGQNSAFAAGAAGPGYTHQIAALNPANPAMQNINVMNRFAEPSAGNGGYYSVSSSSFSSSSDLNGKKDNHRRAETVVNNNGQVTRYKVEN